MGQTGIRRTDLEIPPTIAKTFSPYDTIFEKYGKVFYGIFAPTDEVKATAGAIRAFLDLTFSERKQFPLKSEESDAERMRSGYFAHMLPNVPETDVAAIFADPAPCNCEGLPGTGKYRMAAGLERRVSLQLMNANDRIVMACSRADLLSVGY